MDPFEMRLRDRMIQLDRAAPSASPPVLSSQPTVMPGPSAPPRTRSTGATVRTRSMTASLVGALVVAAVIGIGGWYLTPTAPSLAPGGPRTARAIDWDSGSVRLTADSVRIVTNTHTYAAADITRVAPPDSYRCAEAVGDCISVTSDGSHSDTYRTLELEWREAGVDMRLHFYLAANDRTWWVTQIRTRDGRPAGHEDWLAWTGRFMETPLGKAWHGDLDLVDGVGQYHADDGLTPTGELHLRGMALSAFE
jgi:hypothetical protein